MTPKALKNLLAGNFGRLLQYEAERRPAPLTHEQLAKRAGIGKGSVWRALAAEDEHIPRVDTVDALAGVFNYQAWQLLVPGLDPAAPPELLTPALRQELNELRAMRAQLEELARGAEGRFQPSRAGSGGTGDRQDIGEQQGSSGSSKAQRTTE